VHLGWETFIVVMLIFGAITTAIGQRKNLPLGGSFAAGALLGIIGVIIVICQRPGLPQAPPGMQAVTCPRCNALQNISAGDTTFECWQCKYVAHMRNGGNAKAPAQQELAPAKSATPAKSTKVRCNRCQHVQTVSVSQTTFPCEQCNASLKRRTTSAESS
jgi:ribosomal protein S27E